MDLARHPEPERMQLHEDPLQPLRAMADRVGKEVEGFAKRLDHWYTKSSENENAKHKATVKVLDSFRDFAESNVEELKKAVPVIDKDGLNGTLEQHTKRAEHTEPHAYTNHRHKDKSARELPEWQAELATWELARLVFDLRHPQPGTDTEAAKNTKLRNAGGLDRRSPKAEVWERFIISDDLGREKKAVLRWLQQTANSSERNEDLIMEEWAKQSGKDVDTWTSGWLETKATIKHTKIALGVEGPLDSNVKVSGRTTDGALVTRLDPDAQTRQQCALEKPDVYYENALWKACYEMLRRGDPPSKINDWFKAKKQGYRAICIGASGEVRPDGAPNISPPDFGYLFRRTAYLAAQSASYPYEGAAYGMVSGNFQRIQAISSSWDDHLYAYYNALLLSRFDRYLLAEPQDQPRAQKHPQLNFPGVMEHINNDWENATQKVVELLAQDPATSHEAKTPIKLIQSALLTGTLDDLICKVGVAIADAVQARSSVPTFIVDPDHNAEDAFAAGQEGVFSCRGTRSVIVPDYYQRFLHDSHALRILVHIFIVFGNPRDPLSRERRFEYFARGNVIAAYVEYLRLAQRLQPIPLYAAHLERWRASMTLGRILPAVTDPDEQKRYVKLMRGYGLKVEKTLLQYFNFALAQTGLVVGFPRHEVAEPISKYELLDIPRQGHATYRWPNGQHIKDQVIDPTTRREHIAVVDCLLWYSHLKKKDENELSALVRNTLVIFLLTGRVAAADKLVAHISDGDINVQLQDHLPHFVRLIALFGQWRAEEKKFIDGDDASSKASGPILRDILEAITSTMSIILEPTDDPRHTDLWEIYKIYVPEMILAYLAVLQAAFLFSKREHGIEAMDLSVTVASTKWLSQVFQETKRMRELVGRIADVSLSMMRVGGMSKVKVTKDGKTANIWNLERQS